MSGLEKSYENIVDGHDPAFWDGFSWNKFTNDLQDEPMDYRGMPIPFTPTKASSPHGSGGGVCGCHLIIHYSVDGTLVVFDVGVADCRP